MAIFIANPYLSWSQSRNRAAAMIDSPVFFSGIGGSGMLPLASIVRASGARVVMALVRELRRIGGGYGAAAICGGFGQADAVVVKV